MSDETQDTLFLSKSRKYSIMLDRSFTEEDLEDNITQDDINNDISNVDD